MESKYICRKMASETRDAGESGVNKVTWSIDVQKTK